MTSFRFSEAARVYSRYSVVVDEVRQAWVSDVLSYFGALQVEIAKAISPLPFGFDGEKPSSVFRYWWIGDGAMLGHAGLWMDNWRGSMVHEGRLVLRGGGDKLRPEQIAGLKQLIAVDNFGGTCVPINKGSWEVFHATVSIDPEDPVGSVVRVIAPLLMRMHEAAPPLG